MPLVTPPPQAGSLAGFPAEPTRGRTLYRVWRHELPDETVRDNPWWFASIPDDPADGGRYDLPAPMGACYTATRRVGAILEALQAFLVNLPTDELRIRRAATIDAPADAPPAAKLTARSGVGRHGITAALWVGTDRALTQAWAAAFRRDGWWALYGGIQHDPSGRLRGYTLFDHEGAHPPTYGEPWTWQRSAIHDDHDMAAEMAAFGIHVRDPGDLPFVAPHDSPD